MSEELPQTNNPPTTVAKDTGEETKVIYYIDEEETPYMIKIPVSYTTVTLGDFKNALNRPNFKFFFRSMDDDIGVVKEEITEDATKLPAVNGRVVSWLVTADGSAHSDSSAGAKRHGGALGAAGRVKGVPGAERAGHFGAAAAAFDQTGMTSDSESTVSGLPHFPKHGSKLDRRMIRAPFDGGGAVALDGRIEPGDMILQVNEVSFEQLSNDDAVQVLREAVQKPGPIKLVVAKCWDPAPKGYFTIPRQEPVRPIDPGAWVAHTNAMRLNMSGEYEMRAESATPTPTPGGAFRPPSVSTMTSQNSGSLPESERYALDIQLDINMDMRSIVKAMARPESGLDIKDRTWLKITIPNAFLGSDVVEWLHNHVNGLADRRDARKYASRMLKEGHIKHTVNKITFSEQCYYVFAGDLCGNMNTLRLGPEDPAGAGPLILPLGTKMDDGSQSEHDTVGPLPPPPMTPTPWSSGPIPRPESTDPPSYTVAMMRAGIVPHCPPTAPSMASGYASMPFQYTTTPAGSYPNLAPAVSAPLVKVGDSQSAISGGSGGSSGSEKRKGKQAKAVLQPSAPPIPPMGSMPIPPIPANGATRGVEEIPRDLAGSRQSFRMAMGNPCEFFVDVM